MAKRDPTAEAMKRLAELRTGPASAETKGELASHLESKANLVVAKAAEVIGTLRIGELSGEMERAFERFMDASAEDKGCLAKTAIAKVLNEMGTGTEAVFLRGVRHVQMEGSWGGSTDAAGELRAVSGLGLAGCGSREALTELTDLLMDPLPGCRIAAARGIGHVGHESGALPLRVKLLAGDEEIAVMEECLASLVRLTPRKAVGFVDRMLDDGDDEVRAAAAVALGMTRQREALEILLGRWDREIAAEGRRRLLPAIALARLPEAVEFLVGLVERGHRSVAGEAVEALGPYRHDAQVRQKVETAVAKRGEPGTQERFEAVFGR